MGEPRTREIIERCQERALQHDIQKMPAITILLDLMLTIDPELFELDEYAWAKALLETDMLEPNSKPALILRELEG